MMTRPFSGFPACLILLALPACGEQPPPLQMPSARPVPPPVAVPVPARPMAGQDRVIGKDARTLIQMFGPAAQDVREEGARKLQFANADCILDVYLYPPAPGREPLSTFVSARVPDGRDANEASCIVALSQRR